MQNGSAIPRRETVAEIKEAAKEQARAVRGASATSLLKLARTQISMAHALEGDGDLKGALSALTKSASLAQMFMDSAEFKQEQLPGKKGALVRDFMEFQQVCQFLVLHVLLLKIRSVKGEIFVEEHRTLRQN